MFEALQISATGMLAQQRQVDTLAHNLANASTPGFKRARVSFADLVVAQAQTPPDPAGPDTGHPAGAPARGAGISGTRTLHLFDAGKLRKTDAPLDLAVDGDGFIEVTQADGSSLYTRGGSLIVNAEGLLSHASGLPLKPAIRVPAQAQSLAIEPDGRVSARLPGAAAPSDLGKLELVRFARAEALAPQGQGLWQAVSEAGEPIALRAGDGGAARLAQGSLEESNVKLNDEVVSLVVAQRLYEANARVMQAADEMWGLVNGLRR